jgi:hypothetical protein
MNYGTKHGIHQPLIWRLISLSKYLSNDYSYPDLDLGLHLKRSEKNLLK